MAYTQVGSLIDFTAGTTIVSADVDSNLAAIRSVVNGLVTGSNAIAADTIAEVTSAGGVTIDSVLLKDGGATLSGTVYIGDTSNANVTLGLTINQGAADDHILALKSSDVAHGFTSGGETDTFGAFHKQSATLGGLGILAFAEDAALTVALGLESYGGTADTTKSTAGRSLVEVYVSEHDNANALANITADGNVFGVRARVGGSDLMRWLVDEDGDTWQAGGITAIGDVTTRGSVNFHDASGVALGAITSTAANELIFDSADGSESIRIGGLAGAPLIGFFGATPAGKPTGVAVTAGGIHAALVTLGLIAA